MQMNSFHKDEIDAYIYAWKRLAEEYKYSDHLVKTINETYPQLMFKLPNDESIVVNYGHANITKPHVWFITLTTLGEIDDILSAVLKEMFHLFEDVKADLTDYEVELVCKKPRDDRLNNIYVRSAIFNAMHGIATYAGDIESEPKKDIYVSVTFIDICAEEQWEAMNYFNAIARGYIAFHDLRNTSIIYNTSAINTSESDSPQRFADILQTDVVICHGAARHNWAIEYARSQAIPVCTLEGMHNKGDNSFTPFNSIFAKKTDTNMEKSK